MNTIKKILPAEWATQSAVMLTWPHTQTDWVELLDEVLPAFVQIAKEISQRQQLLIVCADKCQIQKQLTGCNLSNIRLVEVPSNDTWARDHGPLTIREGEQWKLLNFEFNGWGQKFEAALDNEITKHLFDQSVFQPEVLLENIPFVLEGGSVESDGKGTIMTTTQCMLSPFRNPGFTKEQIEEKVKAYFGAERVLWLENGHLEGDDTDAHIDTLARFCDAETIAYVQCTDRQEPHYEGLKKMEEELQQFRTASGMPYRLVPLPFATAVYNEDGERLPATYANFLIINGAILAPVYGAQEDEEVIQALQVAFPKHEIIPVNCRAVIEQNGSLHCLTMQFPEGVL
ncbi:agmatine deiminase family protein [Rapidithrix thailandica]|uniref:Agmatine deiminase family protein n=1 Tax=Rapidithrix thailandica TaxID=413964 RepID=A0AAW9SI77_9BACT